MSEDDNKSRARSEYRDETKSILELTDSFHERGLSLPTRTIYMGTEPSAEGESGVDAKLTERFIKNLHVLESVSDDFVTVIMNNVGGDVYHGLAIYDAITQSPCDVKIVVRGQAMSMASIILQAGDIRVAGPMSVLMMHMGSFGAEGHNKTFLKWADECKRIDALVENIYMKRIKEKQPKFKVAKLRKMLEHDTFFDAKAAIRMGLADEIG